MPLFHYRGVDRQGQAIEGSLQASDLDQAAYLLRERGYRLSALEALGDLGPAPPPIHLAGPVTNALLPAPTAQPSSSGPPIETKPASDKDRFFVFAQISEQVRAGISPAEACQTVARHLQHEDLRQALVEMGKGAERGRSLSDTMARYPDLFPASAVGMVRAGEVGGFLPDALLEVSDQAGRAHKFKRSFWYVWLIGINAAISIPVVLLATRAMLATWRAVDSSGGTGSYGEALRQSYLQKLIWPWGPFAVLAIGGTFYLRHLLSSRRFEATRHRLGLRWPVFGARARHESVTTFTQTLSRLSRSGLSPARSWALAADAVPNLEMREKLIETGRRMGDGSKLSDAAHQSGLFPQEYASILATGELIGDLPGALQRLADVSRGEYEAAQTYAKVRGGCWGLLGCAVTSGIILAILMYFWYHELLGAVLEGLE
ncbi:MAG TPA: type II secretion system F family protein [Fimbriimonadaceae bacterium]|nr:type II secretion system F family protein [Fimbriimonadaceae bacterium]HRJ95867.1 type II secretion system F family protein [Fimbriimonadaceae bacterium]